MIQKYILQPNINGKYEVAKFNVVTRQYEVIESGYTEKIARERASELNKDDYEYEHQDELISKYHDYALSKDAQKQNAAKEFLVIFPIRETFAKKS
ncbi:hypothetical protein V7T85_00160 [Segatella copri]|uniref:hypothetical protein n=1 Tax=Segatella copri TaxID=165179 RepID=UPI002FF30488